MAQNTALQKQIRRIGEIVEQLESTADPNARAMAKELLESLMALHGAALGANPGACCRERAKLARVSSGNAGAMNWSAACSCCTDCTRTICERA